MRDKKSEQFPLLETLLLRCTVCISYFKVYEAHYPLLPALLSPVLSSFLVKMSSLLSKKDSTVVSTLPLPPKLQATQATTSQKSQMSLPAMITISTVILLQEACGTLHRSQSTQPSRHRASSFAMLRLGADDLPPNSLRLEAKRGWRYRIQRRVF